MQKKKFKKVDDDFDFLKKDKSNENKDPLSVFKLKGKTREEKIKELAKAIRLLLQQDE